MKKKKQPIILLVFITLVTSFQMDAQTIKPFQSRFQSYVKGNVVSISNSIVNTREGSNGSNSDYSVIDRSAKSNDEFVMDYIDIDNDPNTFSSSSSTLNLGNKKGTKIVYAGLYWSATYKFEKGKQKKNKH